MKRASFLIMLKNSDPNPNAYSNDSIQKLRRKVSYLAQKRSEAFRECYGHSPLDSIAPFERDEIILGRRVGSGGSSYVYEIEGINLRPPDQSKMYTDEQIMQREVTAKSMKCGARYVMKCLKDNLEEGAEDMFLCAARDIAHEAEMLAALSHPNIIKLQGVVAARHKAFLEGPSQFFIIMEKLDDTLADKIDEWAKEKKPSNLSSSFKRLSSSMRSSSSSINSETSTEDKLCVATSQSSEESSSSSSFQSRLRTTASLASALDYLHSQGIIFRDMKPNNAGFDRLKNLKLFDFGLARFMPRDIDSYEEVYEMSESGTPRYMSHEVMFLQPYNLKADVYSFCVVWWEIMCLKKPYAKYKLKEDLQKAMSRVDFKTLAISAKWPQSIQDIMERGLSRDLWKRPTLREICKVLDDCVAEEVKDCSCSSRSSRSSSLNRFGNLINSPRLSFRRDSRAQKLRISETSSTTVASTYEKMSPQDGKNSGL